MYCCKLKAIYLSHTIEKQKFVKNVAMCFILVELVYRLWKRRKISYENN